MSRKFTRVVFALLLLTLPLVAWLTYLAHVTNKQLAEIRSAGLPTNGEELNQWYAAVPESSNAAIALTKAFELRRNFPDSRSNAITGYKLPSVREPIPSNQVSFLKDYATLNEPMLRKIDEALQLPASRYPLDFRKLMSTQLPHLAWLADVADLYEYKAALAMQAGEMKATKGDIENILGLARTLDNEPCLFSQLVRLRLFKTAFTTLERRANAGALDSIEITDLTTAFGQIRTTNICERALIGERALTIPYFRMTRKQYLEISPLRNSDDLEKGPPLPFNGPPILRLIGYYRLDFGSYLLGMKKALTLARQPSPENLRLDSYLAYVGAESTKRKRTLSGAVFSSWSGIARRENTGIAQQRLALTALAVESYRTQTSHFPEKLSVLVPDFLNHTPEDPFTGSDLKYRRTEKGYVIYSVGPDLKDDNGLEETDKKESADRKSYDITFTVDR